MKSFSARYTMKALLGQGGMGEVWDAWDNMGGHQVAIKMMHVKTSADPGMRKCFHREAEACSLLHHPNIVEIYDYGTTEDNRHYLSMEMIHGCTLHALTSNRLPLSAVLDLAGQILCALSHAHARGVIHRDLKAENVLVCMKNERLVAKLVDFGLAALPQSLGREDTRTFQIGTPGYMAPEQVLHRSALIGPATDIYAVGILLYEMLCGRLPFVGATAFETMRAQISAPIPSLDWHPHFEGLSPEIKAQLRYIIETALSKKTWQRFVSVDEFESELRKIPCSWEDYGDSPLIESLRHASQEMGPQTVQDSASQISLKIREMKGAEHSDVLPVINELDPLLGVVRKKQKHSVHLFQTLERLSETENKLGTDAIFYREILASFSIFGGEASMPEIEHFWQLDEDISLADCWREALASWCSYGFLSLQPTDPYNGHATMKMRFVEPELAAYLQNQFLPPRLRQLKAQAAMALLECYAEPTHDQMWRMAYLWFEADDLPSFAQMGAESAEQALSLGEYETALQRFKHLGQIFDEKWVQSSPDSKLMQAIDWPKMLLNATQTAILLDEDAAFDIFCQRLKSWVERTRDFIWLSHVRWLHAMRHMRQENFQRAIELLNASYEGFLKCGDKLQANRMLLWKADAESHIGEPMMALYTLREAQKSFELMSADLDLACVNMRLSRLEWYAGNSHTANQLGVRAMTVLDAYHASSDKSQLNVWIDFVSFIAHPQNVDLYQLIDSVSAVERYCDDVALAHAQSNLLIAYALNENWEEIDDILLRLGQRSHHAHHTSVLTGTVSCIRALMFARQNDFLQAEDELSLAIASFGPRNRRARAWCHTLLGGLAMVEANLDKGLQAFGRACKDFGLLGDKFGEMSVLIAKSALQTVCGHHHEAFLSAVHGFELALESDFQMHASLSFAIAVVNSMHESAESVLQLSDMHFQVAVPAILRPYWENAMKAALEHYLSQSGFETLTAKLQMLLNEMSRMTAQEPSIGFPSLEIEI